jgi:hypothetical protein
MMKTPHDSYAALNWTVLSLILGCLAIAFSMFALHKALPGVLPTCMSQVVFSRPCPLCGLTRAFAALVLGEFGKARELNALAIPCAMLLIVEIVYRAIVVVLGRRWNLPAWLMRTDILTHGWLMAAYVVYSALFMTGVLGR